MADILEIWGGRPLYGTVTVPSAKNSVLPLLAATVLCREKVCLEKVPLLSDVTAELELLRHLGISARKTGETVQIKPGRQIGSVLAPEWMQRLRASVLFLAPVLSRTGAVEACMPGGCRLGARPIDIHLDGLTQMGAAVHWHEERLYLRAPRGLNGVSYTLRYPSVGATETLLLAAVCAKGETVLHGVAREPEILDLVRFLNACGGRIEGAGTDTIHITGVDALTGGRYTPIPDRIVAATAACACAAAGGRVEIQGIDGKWFAPVLDALQRAGCQIQQQPSRVIVVRNQPLRGIGEIATGVYPGFPTDAAPLLAAALLTATGESCIRDTIFSHRFACAEGFAAMGARVQQEGADLKIFPGGSLHGTTVQAQDLRGGGALVIAALSASGRTCIQDSFYLRRGYPDLENQLRLLGIKVRQQKK